MQLSKENDDFSGGELILVEQRPRMQSRPIVVRLEQGSAAIIPVRDRPRRGVRGFHRAAMRHGVGELTAPREARFPYWRFFPKPECARKAGKR